MTGKFKCILMVFLAVVCLICTSACGMSSDISKKMMIQGIGIDSDENGVLVSVHYWRTGEQVDTDLLQASGATVYEALENLTLQTGFLPTYSHNAMVVFGKQCAQQGLTQVFDFFVRHYQTRPTVNLYVAQDKAQDLFTLQNGENYALSAKAKSFSEADSDVNRFAGSSVLEVTDAMTAEYNAFALPEIQMEQERIQLGNTAYFRDNRLVGYLNREQSRGYLAAVHTLRNVAVALWVPELGTVSVRIEQAKGRIKAEIAQGAPRFQVQITCRAYIAELDLDLRTGLSEQVYAQIQAALSRTLAQWVESAVKQAVVTDKTDIFHFGTALLQQQTDYWRAHRENWQAELEKIRYTVAVEASVDRTQQEVGPAV